jgi:tRNA(His) 5'-end guanylyltransferase
MSDLRTQAEEIGELLRSALRKEEDEEEGRLKAAEGEETEADGQKRIDHETSPFVPKRHWTTLGDLLQAAEHPVTLSIPGERWISLRLDGCGFSKVLKTLRRLGFLESDTFSEKFAAIMKRCVVELMDAMNARCGFTQSDEMTVLIPPASVVRNEQQPHYRNGRVMKLCSMAASIVTARFLKELLDAERHGQAGAERAKILDDMPLPHFDCRLGSYATETEAMSLILWRAYDCSVNGVSDAVHKNHGGAVKQEGTRSKLKWLQAQGLLPLPPHQVPSSFLLIALTTTHADDLPCCDFCRLLERSSRRFVAGKTERTPKRGNNCVFFAAASRKFRAMSYGRSPARPRAHSRFSRKMRPMRAIRMAMIMVRDPNRQENMREIAHVARWWETNTLSTYRPGTSSLIACLHMLQRLRQNCVSG